MNSQPKKLLVKHTIMPPVKATFNQVYENVRQQLLIKQLNADKK